VKPSIALLSSWLSTSSQHHDSVAPSRPGVIPRHSSFLANVRASLSLFWPSWSALDESAAALSGPSDRRELCIFYCHHSQLSFKAFCFLADPYHLFQLTFMVESSDEPSLLDRIRSKAHASSKPFPAGDERPALTLTNLSPPNDVHTSPRLNTGEKRYASNNIGLPGALAEGSVVDDTSPDLPPPAPPPPEERHGETSSTLNPRQKPNIGIRFYTVVKETLMSSWVNVLLIFVPVGIAVQAAGIDPTIIFAMNAIAIIPLAGLLSHATESVASEMGDTIGALMNVTFGNAVELIIL